MARFGVDLSWDTYHAEIRGHSAQPLLEALSRLKKPALDLESISALYGTKNDMFRDMAMQKVDSLMSDEVRELIDDLDEYKLAVVSSARTSHVHPLLQKLGMFDRFQVLVCREDVTELKPSPIPYQTAGKLLGIKRRALVVEDSDAGAESGRGAGFAVVQSSDYEKTPGLVRRALSGR